MRSIPIIKDSLQSACRLMLAAGVMLCVFSLAAFADDRQYKIEAAFLYNFFNYITWPGYSEPQALQKPVICVYGNDPIVSYLDYVRSKMARERALEIRSIGERNSAVGCNILFMRHKLNQPNALPGDTLTVFKSDDPLDRGGMIELFQDEERITIKINQALLEQNGFKISSRLLDLSQRVR